MRNILGHKSWNKDELLSILDKGGYTMPNLPHYRYQRVQSLCRELRILGYLRKTGQCQTGINLVPTEFYKQWRNEVVNNLTTLDYRAYYKLHNPPKPLKLRKCKCCGNEYQPAAPTQKFCSKGCRPPIK